MKKDVKDKQPCPDATCMGEFACNDKSQCWEPCGELGHSEEHAQVAQEPYLKEVSTTK